MEPTRSRGVRLALVALLGAEGISWGGNALARVAVPWFVLEAGGSAAQAGVVVGVEMLPVVLGSIFGAVLVDRLGHKRGSVLSDVVSGVTVALIPLLHALGMLTLPLLMALVFSGALLDSAGIAARKALLPDVAARAAVTLERANAAHAAMLRSAVMLGPALGGALIPVMGTGNVLAFNAATFAVSAVMIGRLVPHARTRPAGQRSSYRTDLIEGLRFVRSDQGLRALLVAPTLLAVLVSPVFFVALPAHLNNVGSALGLGLIYSAYGGGAALGAVAFPWLDARIGRRRLFLLATVGQTAGVAILAALPPPPLLLTAAVLVGVAYGPTSPLLGVVIAERAPASLRARVFGTAAAPIQLATPLGVLIGGALLSALPVGAALAAAALGCAAVALAQLRWPPVHDAEAQTHSPSTHDVPARLVPAGLHVPHSRYERPGRSAPRVLD